MKNGQLKTGYNLQIATKNQFFFHFGSSPNSTDTRTLLPFLNACPFEVKTVVADAGYGSEENLAPLDEQGIDHYIKYGLFDKEQNKPYKTSPKNLKNLSKKMAG